MQKKLLTIIGLSVGVVLLILLMVSQTPSLEYTEESTLVSDDVAEEEPAFQANVREIPLLIDRGKTRPFVITAFEGETLVLQVSAVDDFEHRFFIYDLGPEHPRFGKRITRMIPPDETVTITIENIPAGQYVYHANVLDEQNKGVLTVFPQQ